MSENKVETKVTEQKAEENVAENTNKFGKRGTHTEAGIEYAFQFPGTRKTQEILDIAKSPGFFSDKLYNEQLMEHVIVNPSNINYEYWDEHDGYREVMAAADRFLGGLL